MDLVFLIGFGIFVGIVVAAPVGPVNLICIRRTLAFGRMNGFLSGAGAALGDGVFAVIAAFGLTAVSSTIEGYSGVLQFVGAILLLGMGIHTFFDRPKSAHAQKHKAHDVGAAAVRSDAPEDMGKAQVTFEAGAMTADLLASTEVKGGRAMFAPKSTSGLTAAISSTFLLTVTNPATMLGFVAIFSGLGKSFTENASYASASILVLAVVAGSTLWWLALTTLMDLFKSKMSTGRLKLINRVSGAAIAAFGAVVLVKVISSGF